MAARLEERIAGAGAAMARPAASTRTKLTMICVFYSYCLLSLYLLFCTRCFGHLSWRAYLTTACQHAPWVDPLARNNFTTLINLNTNKRISRQHSIVLSHNSSPLLAPKCARTIQSQLLSVRCDVCAPQRANALLHVQNETVNKTNSNIKTRV